jgi:2-oxoglutarate ferredoxin oxidoreductase subunit delta
MAEVRIRAESCKSCGYCVHFCPKGVLEVGTQVNSKGYPYVVPAHPEKCIGCAMCANMCPDAAIEVYR